MINQQEMELISLIYRYLLSFSSRHRNRNDINKNQLQILHSLNKTNMLKMSYGKYCHVNIDNNKSESIYTEVLAKICNM